MQTELLNKDEAAARARIKAATLMRHISAGTGPTITKIGGRIFFNEADVAAWIAGARVPSGLSKPVA